MTKSAFEDFEASHWSDKKGLLYDLQKDMKKYIKDVKNIDRFNHVVDNDEWNLFIDDLEKIFDKSSEKVIDIVWNVCFDLHYELSEIFPKLQKGEMDV